MLHLRLQVAGQHDTAVQRQSNAGPAQQRRWGSDTDGSSYCDRPSDHAGGPRNAGTGNKLQLPVVYDPTPDHASLKSATMRAVGNQENDLGLPEG